MIFLFHTHTPLFFFTKTLGWLLDCIPDRHKYVMYIVAVSMYDLNNVQTPYIITLNDPMFSSNFYS